jgi:LacI family transcriptional regulator
MDKPLPQQPAEPCSSPAASIGSVAKRAGVSIATVSRVMNSVSNKASQDTIDRVRQAVLELGYRPVGAGRALRRGKSRLVAVLASNLSNPSMAAVAAATETALRSAGYVMVLCDTHDDPKLQDEYLLEMRAQYACGLVLLGAVASPVLQDFVSAREPLVFVNRRNPFGNGRYVGVDNAAAGEEVAAWFIQNNRLNVALIHGSSTSSATADRIYGFKAGLSKNGISLPRDMIFGSKVLDHLQIGYEGIAKIMRKGIQPEGVFCTSDLIAYGAHRWLCEQHIDLTATDIVGFDDSPMNPWIAPWLHAVQVPYSKYGNAIVRALASQEEETIILDYQLVIRRTQDHNASSSTTEKTIKSAN